MALVPRDVLLADHVGRASNPIDSVPAVVAVDICIDRFWGRQIWQLILVPSKLKLVELFLSAASHLDFTIDWARGLTEKSLLWGNKTCVAGQVFTVPTTGSFYAQSRKRRLNVSLGLWHRK